MTYMLYHGDCCEVLRTIPAGSVDAIITDPPYPCIKRDYGYWTEAAWMEMMRAVIPELRRVLKPRGSAMLALQPNSERIGQMRTWLWEFLAWVGREWNVVQDTYWWNTCAMPNVHTRREHSLLRPSMKHLVWLGAPDCYRDQDAILWSESDENRVQRATARAGRRYYPSGHNRDAQRISGAAEERGGVTPYNVFPVANSDSCTSAGARGHGAGTPIELSRRLIRYICPPGGLVLDPFAGTGSIGVAALREGRRYLGIERLPHYVASAEQWLAETTAAHPLQAAQ